MTIVKFSVILHMLPTKVEIFFKRLLITVNWMCVGTSIVIRKKYKFLILLHILHLFSDVAKLSF